jgi:hypothetical protein
MENDNIYLQETEILNFSHDKIKKLIEVRKWKGLLEKEKINQIYLYVRDEIKFAYNTADNISASKVLNDGYGQCNTKGNLFMALLRAVEIPCRIHGFTIDKALQKGAISGVWYKLSPNNIIHSWVEVKYKNKWYNLEGFILDKLYLNNLQSKFSDCKTTFCGYGVYTDNFLNPIIDWNENDTYIQNLGINNDFGVFNSPDEFYKKHKQALSPLKVFAYKNLVRHRMNKNVNKIRDIAKNR